MNPPRATVSGEGAMKSHFVGDQVTIPPHVVPVPGLGDVLFYHATSVCVAEIALNEGPHRIALQLAMPGCKCGCGSRGRGLFLTPGPEEARLVAEQLIKFAERYEAKAQDEAAAALRKAAGK